MALMTASSEFSLIIKKPLINYYTKTRRFMSIDYAVCASAGAGRQVPPTSHLVQNQSLVSI